MQESNTPAAESEDGVPKDGALVGKAERLLSLDVYRGLVMLLLASSGLGIAKAAAKGEGAFAEWLQFQGTHPEWVSQTHVIGFSLWDMIQPAFMFIVGVSMPFSYEKRAKLGESFGRRMRHAWTRAILLTLFGVFLQSMRKDDTYWIFTNVLSQIGLGYGFLFFLVGRKTGTQFLVGGSILVLYWAAMVIFPRGLGSLAEHFENMKSMPQQFDLWFLNQFPREKPFTGHAYATLNFIPSLVTMLMGLMCGQVLKDKETSGGTKIRKMVIAAVICLVLSLIAGATICPIIKKLWTPSWTLFSGAYVIGALALLYWIVDVKKWNAWVFPFVVVGLNPLTMYLLGMICKGWFSQSLKTHLPDFLFTGGYAPVVEATLIVTLFWLILWWMYRNRIFIRL